MYSIHFPNEDLYLKGIKGRIDTPEKLTQSKNNAYKWHSKLAARIINSKYTGGVVILN